MGGIVTTEDDIAQCGCDGFYQRYCPSTSKLYRSQELYLPHREKRHEEIVIPSWKTLNSPEPEQYSQIAVLTKKQFKREIKRFVCPITNIVMRQPVQLTCCQKYFQANAIQTVIKAHGKCPLCRYRLSEKQLNPGYENNYRVYDHIVMLRLEIRKTYQTLKKEEERKQWKEQIDLYMGEGYFDDDL